jgi:peptidoglycan/xylan/chitin deacetylase (PgdA/CDA1 family)
MVTFILIEAAIIKYPDTILQMEKFGAGLIKHNSFISGNTDKNNKQIIKNKESIEKEVQNRISPRDTDDIDYIKSINGIHTPNNPKKCAYLTFDDGPYITITPKILDTLKEYDVKATFFMQGWAISTYPSVAKRVYEEGHAIGNHTYSHKKEMYNAINVFKSEIERTNNLIYKLTGDYPRLFRPPYGRNLQPDYKKYLVNIGLRTFLWNDDSGDSREVNVATSKIYKNVALYLNGKKDIIIILHDSEGHINTSKVLGSIIKLLWKEGYVIKPIKPDVEINAGVEVK